MGAILVNGFGLFCIIFLAYFLKTAGILTKADGSILTKIILNATLPAAIIVNLAQMTVQINTLVLILVAIAITVIQVVVGYFVTYKDNLSVKQLVMYCGSGFNIGNFGLPFIQSFLPLGIPMLSMFDLGNSIMLAGGTTVIIELLIGKNTKLEPGKILLNLLKSPMFVCYIVMFLLGLIHFTLPAALVTLLQPIASANTFLSMFMIGLFLEFRLPKSDIVPVCQVLFLRYGIGVIMFLISFFLPLDATLKLILCLLSFSPIPLFGVINSVLGGAKEETVGFASSLSFLISLPIMMGIVLLFGK